MTTPIFAESVSSSSSLDDQEPRVTSGARLVSADGRPLPLEHTRLTCEAGGGIARSVLRQRFRNSGQEALEVTYLLPLPSEGAVTGYSFELAGVVTRGRVESARLARERYEEALLEGRSAALLEQERSSLFRQAIGNVPAGQHIDLEVSVDHPLSWLGGGWELRFPTVVAPRYQTADHESSVVPLALGETVAAEHEVRLTILDEVRGAPRSPSHALYREGSSCQISHARLDRDVVVRWDVARAELGARLETASIGADRQLGLLTLVPPEGSPKAVPRDLIVLLDTSGSMQGEPLAQAVRVVSALVSSLKDDDQLELIEFGTAPRRFKPGPVSATAEQRSEAIAWLSRLRAGGGTEMRSGITAALASLRPGAQRQVVLVSDGLIGFEREVLGLLLRGLPESSRFHSVGVGHGTNRSLLMPAARAGRGACIIITPGEDVEPACARLLARTAAPLVVNLRVSGSALLKAPLRPLDLYAGCPALVPLALRAEGGSLELSGETPDGRYVERLPIAPREVGTGQARVAALYARDRIEDLELTLAADTSSVESAEREIEQLGLTFGLASRLTSWVAVSEQINVDGTRATRRVEQPHQLAAGISAEGLGLRQAPSFVGGGMIAKAAPLGATMRRAVLPPMAMAPTPAAPAAPPPQSPPHKSPGLVERARHFFSGRPPGQVRFRGKVRLERADKLAVTFEVAALLDWRLPERVKVLLADGSQLDLDLAPAQSTSDGQLDAGSAVRLVFELQAPLPAAVRQLSFELEGVTWTIDLVA
jgi:Ca-activated chloride channel family protein